MKVTLLVKGVYLIKFNIFMFIKFHSIIYWKLQFANYSDHILLSQLMLPEPNIY